MAETLGGLRLSCISLLGVAVLVTVASTTGATSALGQSSASAPRVVFVGGFPSDYINTLSGLNHIFSDPGIPITGDFYIGTIPRQPFGVDGSTSWAVRVEPTPITDFNGLTIYVPPLSGGYDNPASMLANTSNGGGIVAGGKEIEDSVFTTTYSRGAAAAPDGARISLPIEILGNWRSGKPRSEWPVLAAFNLTATIGESYVPALTNTPPSTIPKPHLWVVALGDSYTAGNGVPPYYTTDKCSRSYRAYPWLYLNRLRSAGYPADIWQEACGGDVTGDVPQQITAALRSPAGRSANVVLLTIGGNDLDFSWIVKSCLLPDLQGLAEKAYCSSKINSAVDNMPIVISRTRTILSSIATKMPHAQIVLIGYPLLTSPRCPTTPWNQVIAEAQQTFNLDQQQLIGRLNGNAGTTRFHFVSTAQSFLGHGPCAAQATQWINGFSAHPLASSYHPNLKGNSQIADLLFGRGFQG